MSKFVILVLELSSLNHTSKANKHLNGCAPFGSCKSKLNISTEGVWGISFFYGMKRLCTKFYRHGFSGKFLTVGLLIVGIRFLFDVTSALSF